MSMQGGGLAVSGIFQALFLISTFTFYIDTSQQHIHRQADAIALSLALFWVVQFQACWGHTFDCFYVITALCPAHPASLPA